MPPDTNDPSARPAHHWPRPLATSPAHCGRSLDLSGASRLGGEVSPPGRPTALRLGRQWIAPGCPPTGPLVASGAALGSLKPAGAGQTRTPMARARTHQEAWRIRRDEEDNRARIPVGAGTKRRRCKRTRKCGNIASNCRDQRVQTHNISNTSAVATLSSLAMFRGTMGFAQSGCSEHRGGATRCPHNAMRRQRRHHHSLPDNAEKSVGCDVSAGGERAMGGNSHPCARPRMPEHAGDRDPLAAGRRAGARATKSMAR